MSFVKNDNQQISLLDSTFNLTERETNVRKIMDKNFCRQSFSCY